MRPTPYTIIPVCCSQPIERGRQSFLDLPAETRQEIHNLMFKEDDCVVWRSYRNKHTGFLLTCCQLYSEASEVFYGSNRFEFNDDVRKATPGMRGLQKWARIIGPRNFALVKRVTIVLNPQCQCKWSADGMFDVLPLVRLAWKNRRISFRLDANGRSTMHNCWASPTFSAKNLCHLLHALIFSDTLLRKKYTRLLDSIMVSKSATKMRVCWRAGKGTVLYEQNYEVGEDSRAIQYITDHKNHYRPMLDRLPGPIITQILQVTLDAPKNIVLSSPAGHAETDQVTKTINILGINSCLRKLAYPIFGKKTIVFEEVSTEPRMTLKIFDKYFKWRRAFRNGAHWATAISEFAIRLNFVLPNGVHPDEVRVNIGPCTESLDIDFDDFYETNFYFRVTSTDEDMVVEEHETVCSLDDVYDRAAKTYDVDRDEFEYIKLPGVWIDRHGEVVEIVEYDVESDDLVEEDDSGDEDYEDMY